MKIKSIKAYSRGLALKKPYTIARHTIYDTENVFCEIELENGIVGLGAACPEGAVVGETADVTVANLHGSSISALIGKDIRSTWGLISVLNEEFGNFPGTMAAVDIALHDAFAQYLGIPLVDLYGRRHSRMLTSITIGIKGVDDTIREAREYRSLGFKALKVKTGLDAEEDAARILKLREEFGDHFSIRVDANTGYDEQMLQTFLRATANSNIEVIEQPFLPGKESDLLKFDGASREVFAADESLTSPATALSLLKNRPYGVFNIKLMKCGGVRNALEIASIARNADIKLFWGCNDESIISITAALNAAFACPHTAFLDLDGSFDLAEDIVSGGFILENGYLSLPTGHGLGVKKIEYD